jgi:hypothetical protein
MRLAPFAPTASNKSFEGWLEMFKIDPSPFAFVFLWECEECGANNDDDMGKRGAIAAHRTALKHAKTCLTALRTRQGTDVWAADYTPEEFLAEIISVEARGTGYSQGKVA